MKPTALPLILAGVLGLAGCQHLPEQDARAVAPNLDSIDAAMAESAATDRETVPALPPDVQEALLPPVSVELPEQARKVEQRFDIAVNEIPARQFFMGLVADSPYNMVMHPDVAGSLTLDLKNVSVEDVMQTVRDVYGYEYRRNGNVYQVMPARMRSRIFKIDYLDIQRTGSSRTRVSSGQVSEAAADNDNEDNGDSGSGSSDNGDDRSSVSGSEVNTRSESDFWTELDTALSMLIGEEEGRRVVINAHAGLIVVRALPGELRDVEDYLATLQDVVQRQVILEAKIVEVELNEGFRTGINWSALGEPESGETVFGGQAGGGSIITDGVAEFAGDIVRLGPGNGIIAAETTSFGGMNFLSINMNDFTAFLELLKSQGKVQVLSSPRVSTVNNQKAVIKVGTDEFFVTDVETDTNTTLNTTNQSVNVELTPFFSGVALDVIPQISADDEVTLHIHPTVSEVSERTKSINVSTETSLEIPLALSSIRESDTIIRARSGQIVVIGGLMKDQQTNEVAKTPWLGDVPMFGKLFQHQRERKTKSELVILLRPIVTSGSDDNTWNEQVRQSAERIGRMQSPGPDTTRR